MNRPRAADDFATIRARMEELRHEREVPEAAEGELKPDPAMHRTRSVRWTVVGAGPGRVSQSGSGRG